LGNLSFSFNTDEPFFTILNSTYEFVSEYAELRDAANDLGTLGSAQAVPEPSGIIKMLSAGLCMCMALGWRTRRGRTANRTDNDRAE
jgi:hypothetical protein